VGHHVVSDARLSQLAGRPSFSRHEAAAVVRAHWNIDGPLEPLPSERDQNWLVSSNGRTSAVAKFVNSNDDALLVDMQRQMMTLLSANGIPCPTPIPTIDGQWTVLVGAHLVWLIDYLPGTVMASTPRTTDVCRQLGEIVGASAVALTDFDHPAAHREIQWDITLAGRVFVEYSHHVTEPWQRNILQRVHHQFDTTTLPAMASLDEGVIHNDANDHNVLVADGRVSALLDFGDAVHTAVINDLAIACAYAMLDCPNPIEIREALVAGYERHRPLLPDERRLLPDLICTRLAVSVAISADQRTQQPDNDYLTVSERSAWKLLTRLEDQRES
jgi:Ser/Thr protein kinase RdoA (MazF antagonist)